MPSSMQSKAQFEHIDANTLDFYKIPVAEDEIDTELGKIDHVDTRVRLHPIHKLSKVFSDPLPDDHLYVVIIKPPAGECEWLLCVLCVSVILTELSRTVSWSSGISSTKGLLRQKP